MDREIEFVRLRSVADGKYLHACDDGETVRLDTCRESYKAVWTIEKGVWTDREGRRKLVLHFRGAYGLYLGALERPPRSFLCPRVIALQRDFDEPDMKAIMWHPIESEDDRNAGKLQSLTEYDLNNLSDTSPQALLWKPEYIPRSLLGRPQSSIDAKPKWLKKVVDYLKSMWYDERRINWVLADSKGTIDEEGVDHFMFTGSNRICLEEKLRKSVRLPFTACIRAGRFGLPTPLCLDLPSSKGPFHIVLFLKDTQGGARLGFPDVTHQGREVAMSSFAPSDHH